jgi:hypothetical protein
MFAGFLPMFIRFGQVAKEGHIVRPAHHGGCCQAVQALMLGFAAFIEDIHPAVCEVPEIAPLLVLILVALGRVSLHRGIDGFAVPDDGAVGQEQVVADL